MVSGFPGPASDWENFLVPKRHSDCSQASGCALDGAGVVELVSLSSRSFVSALLVRVIRSSAACLSLYISCNL